MKLILYNNFSETNKLDKNIVKIIELDGNLREASSLINPSILIELNPNNINDLIVDDNHDYVTYNGIRITWNSFIYNYVLSTNYVYIPEFNRYYFINDIISVRTNMWRLNMHVDVLMSYKTQIRNLYAFVNRNEYEYNLMVKDDLISYYYDKEVNEFIPSKGDKVNTTFNPNQDTTKNTIIINCINEDVGTNFSYSSAPDDSLPLVRASASGDDMTSKTYSTYAVEVAHLSKRIQADDTLATFILSIIVYPFVIPYSSTTLYLKLGDTELTDTGTTENPNNDEVYVNSLSTHLSLYHVIADFILTKHDFMDYEPYSQYEIYLPYLGWVSLSADNILDCRLIVYYVINYASGSSQVNIYDVTHDKVIYTGNCQLGVKLGINTTNNREVNDNRNSNNIALGVGLITSALSVATMNPLAIAGGVVNAGKTIANYIQNQNTNYSRASGSINSGLSGLYAPQDVKIRITKMKPKNYDDNYAKLYGKPLNKYMKVDELNGFTILGEVHIEDIGSITSNEFDELYVLLTTGFII